MYSRPVSEIIEERRSCRSYDGSEPSMHEALALRECLERSGTDWEGKQVRLRLLSKQGERGKRERLGTYGFVSRAQLFLAGAWPLGDPAIERFGYAFEKAILAATDRGLQSCWMAGTVNRKGFEAAMGLGEGEAIPAVSPIGRAAPSPTLVDNLVRATAKSALRKPMEEILLDGSGSGLPAEAAGPYAPSLEAVRLAPSASNKQPWRIMMREGAFEFRLSRSPGYRKAFPFDIQRSDIGIAMCHFELVAREAGLRGSWAPAAPADAKGADAAPSPGCGELVATWIAG